MLGIHILSSFLCGGLAGLLIRLFYQERGLFNFTGFSAPASRDTGPNLLMRFLENPGRNLRATGPMFLLGVALSAFTESMAEAGKSVSDYLGHGERIAYVNVMNRLSIDCDCDGNPAEPDLHDTGILASADPVALDQACIDLVYAQKDGDGASLVSRIESRNGLHTLEHAEEIGLGSRSYQIVNID